MSALLNDIKEQMENIQELSGPERKKAGRQLIEHINKNGLAEEIIEEHLQNIADGEQNKSNFNPNGFTKLGILKVGDSALRIHIGDPSGEIPEGARVQEDAHDHRWSLHSLSVTGHMKHEILGKTSKPEGAEKLHHYEYSPRNGKEYFEMQDLGEEYLRKTGEKNPEPGDITSLDAHAIHRASYPDPEELTVTLVLTDEDRGRATNSIWANDEVHEHIKENGTTPSPQVGVSQTISLGLRAHEESFAERIKREEGRAPTEHEKTANRPQCPVNFADRIAEEKATKDQEVTR